MDEKAREEIRFLMEELKGYLTQAPNPSLVPVINERPVWENYNRVIEELNTLTGRDYSKFKVIAEQGTFKVEFVGVVTYRSNLSGLINRLRAEYLPDEPEVSSQNPTTVINQTITQQQSVQHLALELQSVVDKKLLGSADLEPKERTFLEKVKSSLGNVTSFVEAINTILKLAKDLGIDPSSLIKMFS